jgi:hypothetical protein
MNKIKEIGISKMLSNDLALRAVASDFFSTIESYPEKEVSIDFSNVFSISRSFAHEYHTRKLKTDKMIQTDRKQLQIIIT